MFYLFWGDCIKYETGIFQAACKEVHACFTSSELCGVRVHQGENKPNKQKGGYFA